MHVKNSQTVEMHLDEWWTTHLDSFRPLERLQHLRRVGFHRLRDGRVASRCCWSGFRWLLQVLDRLHT